MFTHQGVELLERIRRTRSYGLIGGSVALGVGFEVSKAHARPSGCGMGMMGVCVLMQLQIRM